MAKKPQRPPMLIAQPRTYSFRKVGWVLLVLCALSIFTEVFQVVKYFYGTNTDIASMIVPLFIAIVSGAFAVFCLYHAEGVDPDKVWSTFGTTTKEVRFDQIDRISFKPASNSQYGYRVYQVSTSVFFRYGFRDYSLALIRILQELPKRTMQIDRVPPHDQRWEEKANQERERIFHALTSRYRPYFDEHPEHMEGLKRLVNTPLARSL